MKVVIELNDDNAAFMDNDDELFNVLSKALERICFEAHDTGKLFDSNGNSVGTFKVTKRQEVNNHDEIYQLAGIIDS